MEKDRVLRDGRDFLVLEVLTHFSFGERVARPCTRRVHRLGESGVFGVFPVQWDR